MTLILVADGAYPHPPYDFLPHDVAVWAGYLGGHTPHPWTAAEIAAVRAVGLRWWGIWTAPDRRAIDGGVGVRDAAGTVARLIELDYPHGDPVFYDVEYATWTAGPSGARSAISAWKRGLAAAGYKRTFAYVPWSAQFDWVARWTGVRPATLPAGVVGVQYDHALHNDAYDISVFDPALINATEGADMALDPNDPTVKRILALEGLIIRGDDPDPATGDTHPANLTNLLAKQSAQAAQLAALKAEMDEVKTLLAALTVPVQGQFTITGQGTVGGG